MSRSVNYPREQSLRLCWNLHLYDLRRFLIFEAVDLIVLQLCLYDIHVLTLKIWGLCLILVSSRKGVQRRDRKEVLTTESRDNLRGLPPYSSTSKNVRYHNFSQRIGLESFRQTILHIWGYRRWHILRCCLTNILRYFIQIMIFPYISQLHTSFLYSFSKLSKERLASLCICFWWEWGW